MGLADAHLDEHGYVYATHPGDIDKKVPVICFCSHMDTSPDCSGANVKPQIVRNYRGGDIALPADPAQVIRVADYPGLNNQIGNDIITTDGTTLLGADNKAGVAEIMDAAQFLLEQSANQARHHQDPVHARRGDRPRRRQGRPEEARRRFRLHHGWRNRRHISRTRRSRPTAPPSPSTGVSTHPGFAKGKMEHAIKIAAAHRRSPAEGDLLAGDHRGQRGFSASDRHLRRAGAGDAELHRARFHRGRA